MLRIEDVEQPTRLLIIDKLRNVGDFAEGLFVWYLQMHTKSASCLYNSEPYSGIFIIN